MGKCKVKCLWGTSLGWWQHWNFSVCYLNVQRLRLLGQTYSPLPFSMSRSLAEAISRILFWFRRERKAWKWVAIACISLLPSSVFVNAKNTSASYQREVLRTLKPFTFANMWHMFLLANALGCMVQSMYPDVQNPGTNRSLINLFIFLFIFFYFTTKYK